MTYPPAADLTSDFTLDLPVPAPLVPNWPGNVAIDAVPLTAPPPLATLTYREIETLADPAAPMGLTAVDPLLGVAAFSAQLGEFAAGLALVLAELQARSERMRG